MNDPKTIQERLRELTWWGGPLSGVYPLIGEAADRIEELDEALRLAYTALERVTPDVHDHTWFVKTVLPTVKKALNPKERYG